MYWYASNASRINNTKNPAAIRKLAFFTNAQTGMRFLFPFVPSSSSDAMVFLSFVGRAMSDANSTKCIYE